MFEPGGYGKFLKHPVGTGPFQFVDYQPQNKLVLKAHEHYFRGAPCLKGVSVYFMPDSAQREAKYRSNCLDVIYGTGAPGWLERMEKLPKTRVDVFGPGFTGMFHFNPSIKPLNDLRVRKAMMHAMDRQAFLHASSGRLVSLVLAPISADFLSGGLTNEKVEALNLAPAYDLGRAKELLARAGYESGFDLDMVVSEKRLYRKTFEVLKEQLARINVRLKLTRVSHSLYSRANNYLNKDLYNLYFPHEIFIRFTQTRYRFCRKWRKQDGSCQSV
ncbi:MAG: hypothetical protein HUN05_06535 [Desulfobacter sp.]|nr:MAG: hypothetical protein HUN05_06535 [Desulfobacter sp.]